MNELRPKSNLRSFLGVIYVQKKSLFIIGIVSSVILAFYFVIKLDIEMAILPMMVLFSLTNLMRADSFQKQGMVREAKWMRILSIFFAIAFVVLFIMNVVM